MTTNFVLLINSDVNSQGSYSAMEFANELVAQGQKITQVFFYQDGVTNTNKLCSPASDEVNLVEKWQQLHQSHNIELVSCVAASLRRGIVDKQLAEEQHLSSDNLAEGFRLGGLGEFVEASSQADKLIQF